jgi:multidrug efflux pump subunit AcrB
VFLTGIGKFLFTPLAIAVAFSIGASYFVAIMVMPLFCANFLRPPQGGTQWERAFAARFAARFDRGFERLHERYEVWLGWTMEHEGIVLGGTAAAFGAALMLSSFVGRDLFPAIDAGQLTIQVRAPSGTRIERTEEMVGRVEDTIRAQVPPHDLAMVISNIGVLLDWPAAYTSNAGPQDAFIDVQFTNSRSHSSQRYAAMLRQVLDRKFPDIEFSFHSGGIVTAALNQGLPSPIDIQVTGNSLETAERLADRIKNAVTGIPGAVDVRTKQKLDYPAIRVEVDRLKAAYLGLTPKQVVQNVVTSLNSSVNFDPAFWIDSHNGNHYFMGAQYPEDAIRSIDTLLDIPITTMDGTGSALAPLPYRGAPPKPSWDHRLEPLSSDRGGGRFSLLRNLAIFHYTTAPTEVDHLNINRVLDVYVNVSGRDVGGVASDIERKLDRLGPELPSGYNVFVRGEVQSMRESFSSLSFALVMAAILIYLVMVAQFKSFLDPLVVMLAVPLEIIGVVVVLLLTSTTFNIQSFLGVIFVVGIAVSNEVLIVDFANRLYGEGRSLCEAVMEASKIRMRPILMTSLATLIALLPMAIGVGHGSEANIPLARAVLGGFSVATAASLFVVPVLYVLFKRNAGERGRAPR